MMKENLATDGYCKISKSIDNEWLEKIKDVLPAVFEEHEGIRRRNGNPIKSSGIAMNVLVGNQIFMDFLQHLIHESIIEWIEGNYFNGKCILNSFSALSNVPGEDKVFHKKIHRDIRRFSGDIPILLNMLVMLDDFTVANGATLLLPHSHQKDEVPSDEEFYKNCIHATGSAGDVMIWNSNLLHASGVNTTAKVRRALPITFSLPYYKQLLDYPRAIGYEKYEHFDPTLRRILGYDSRVPAELSEWYSSPEKLLYKNN